MMGEFIHVKAGGGKELHLMGQREMILESNDKVTVFVNHLMPGMGVPMHIHRKMDEACYVLAGRIKFVAGEQAIEAGPGDYVSCPMGTNHGFVGIGDEPITLLWVCNPGHYDKFFEAMAAIPMGPDGPDMAEAARVAASLDTELTGPPPV